MIRDNIVTPKKILPYLSSLLCLTRSSLHQTCFEFCIHSTSKKKLHNLLLQNLFIEMENLCLKFPYLCSIIFANLDNKSLVQCRLVNKSWKKLIDNEKILWKRILKKYITNLTSKCWYEILVRIPVDIIRDCYCSQSNVHVSTTGLALILIIF